MFPIVEVIWDDAHVSTGETTVKRAQRNKPVRTHTVGYLIGENDSGLTLITDQYPDDKKTGKVHNFIGWGMIVEWYYLEDRRRNTGAV